MVGRLLGPFPRPLAALGAGAKLNRATGDAARARNRRLVIVAMAWVVVPILPELLEATSARSSVKAELGRRPCEAIGRARYLLLLPEGLRLAAPSFRQ